MGEDLSQEIEPGNTCHPVEQPEQAVEKEEYPQRGFGIPGKDEHERAEGKGHEPSEGRGPQDRGLAPGRPGNCVGREKLRQKPGAVCNRGGEPDHGG